MNKKDNIDVRVKIMLIIADTLETAIMECEEECSRQNVHIKKRMQMSFDYMKKCIDKIRKAFLYGIPDGYAKDSDMLYAFILMLVDKCSGKPDMMYKIFNMVKNGVSSTGTIDFSEKEREAFM